MEKDIVMKKLAEIVGEYSVKNIGYYGKDLMDKPAPIPPYDMAALFVDIEKEFDIDLNDLIPKLEVYSVEKIAESIMDANRQNSKPVCFTEM